MKAGKIPKLFRKPLTQKQFEKKILSRIHQPREEEFVRSLFEQGEDGLFRLTQTGAKGELKHLGRLSKAIGKNQGIVTGWKAAMLLVPASGAALFSAVFMDNLLERAIERALESVFEARADMDGLDAFLANGTFTFDRLTVGDKDRAMKNLFELGPADISVDPAELLKKKVVIERIESRTILFGTDRSTSGLLPESEKKQGDGEKSGQALEPLLDAGQELALGSAEALLAQYRDKLVTPPLLSEINETVSVLPEKWETEVASISEQVDSVQRDAQSVLDRDPSKISTVPELESYIRSVTDLGNGVSQAKESVDSGTRELRADLGRLDGQREELEKAIETDQAYLRSAAGSFSADLSGAVRRSAEEMVRKRVGEAARMAEKAIGYYRALTAGRGAAEGQEEEPAAPEERRGTKVLFPDSGYPPFLLRSFVAEFGTAGEDGYTLFTMEEISSAPRLWDRPAAARLVMDRPGGDISADLVINAEEGGTDVQIGYALDGYPLSGVEIDALELERLDASVSTAFRASLNERMSGSVSGGISLTGLEYRFAADGGLIARAAESVFEEMDIVDLETVFSLENGTPASIEVRTDLDRKIADALLRFGREETGRQAEALAAEFRASIAEDLALFDDGAAELRELQDALLGEQVQARALEEALAEKRAEAEAAIKNKAAGEGKKVLDSIGKSLGF